LKAKEIGNTALHVLVMGGVLAALPQLSHWWLILCALVWSSLREQAQHRYILVKSGAEIGGTLYWVTKRTFFDFGWLGWKQVREIAETTGGAVLACAIGALVK